MKKMNLDSILKNIFIAFVSIFMIGCNSSDDLECLKCDTAPTTAKSDLQHLGWTVPFSIHEMQNAPSIYTLGLMPHARVFSFNENVLNNALYDEMPDGRKIHDLYGSKFLKLLKESERDDVPVSVYILPETNEIWWVEEATEADKKSYEASKQI
tara:strand:- start:7551 stop:8012 length:462 start_codon:yes stop_codon:yes gene_type:complete